MLKSSSTGAGLLALMEPALAQAAGAGAAPVSLQLDLAAPAGEGALQVAAAVDRATRTLVFAHAEARRADGALVATVAGVFKRAG